MKKLIILLSIILLYKTGVSAQDINKGSLLVELTSGILLDSRDNYDGKASGLSLNYLFDRNVLSIRFMNVNGIKNKSSEISFVNSGWPVANNLKIEANNIKINEFSILYGRRIIKNKHYYILIGPSYSLYKSGFEEPISEIFPKEIVSKTKLDYLGLSYELDVMWFLTKKTPRFSLGSNLFGNFSRQSYIGLGINIGIRF